MTLLQGAQFEGLKADPVTDVDEAFEGTREAAAAVLDRTPSIAVRVISLVRSKDRRKAMAAQLNQVNGLTWSFFDACEARPDFLPYDANRTRRISGREMSVGEIGCFASHFCLWRWFLDSSHDILIVLEDDLLVDTQFFGGIANFCEAVKSHDYVRLYAKAPARALQMRRLMGRYIVRYRDYVFGTQGYILRRPGAEKLLRSIDRIDRPIDIEIDRYWAHGVRNIALTPFPMIEMQIKSEIGDDRLFRPPLTLVERALWTWNRITEKLRRRVFNFVYYCQDMVRIHGMGGY